VTSWETGTDELLLDVSDGVATLTMNRPERRNALTPTMLDALGETLARVEASTTVHCVVITGAGGAFCAGGDVKAMAEGSGADVSFDARVHQQRLNQRAVSGRLYEMPKPTIAAIPGAAAGAGLGIALACDLRYATPSLVMTTAFAKVGLLTRLVGPSRAKEMFFFSERIDAERAEALGLVNDVLPEDGFMDAVAERARSLANGPAVAYRYMKENLNHAVHGEWGECLDMEAVHHLRTGLTEDHREAASAFVEKRTPNFKGR
jgi:2-(1,2-epoxy-1,2-dihydrophenyl)acetyl-CoA isomerase